MREGANLKKRRHSEAVLPGQDGRIVTLTAVYKPSVFISSPFSSVAGSLCVGAVWRRIKLLCQSGSLLVDIVLTLLLLLVL